MNAILKVFSRLNHLRSDKGAIRYMKNSSWLFAEKILRMVVVFFVGVWLARYLGPKQFGLFSYAQSFVGLFMAIASLGLDGILVRELLKYEKKRDKLLGTAFILKFFGAFLVVIFIFFAIQFTENDSYTNRLIFIIASATFLHSFNIIDFYFQSKVLSKYTVYARSGSLAITSTVKIIMILKGASLIAFAWVIVLESIILTIGYIYFYMRQKDLIFNKKHFSFLNWQFDIQTALNLLRDSWPLMFSFIAISIYVRIDQVMIKEMLGAEAVGQYAVAARLSEAWYFIPSVIAMSLFPAIINARKRSKELYYLRLQKLYDLMVWMAIVIALPMTFLSDWIINLLYGSEYNQAGSVLMIHIWSGVFVFLGIAFGQYLIAENFTKKALYRTLLGAVSNIILNYFLLPIYGIKGAAVATLLSQFIVNYAYDFFDKDLRLQFKMKTMSFFPIHLIKVYKTND